MSLLLDRVEEALAPPSGLLLYARSMSRITSRLRFIEPQLASPVDQPPEGKHWIHEIKHDGYRCQVLVERGEARVFTRNGYDWTERYPSAILGCEARGQDHNGASEFEALGSALRQRPHSIILYAFDLLHLDGKDLRQQTLVERRASLKAPLGTDARSRIQFNSSDFVQLTPKQGPAPAMLGAAATGLKRGE